MKTHPLSERERIGLREQFEEEDLHLRGVASARRLEQRWLSERFDLLAIGGEREVVPRFEAMLSQDLRRRARSIGRVEADINYASDDQVTGGGRARSSRRRSASTNAPRSIGSRRDSVIGPACAARRSGGDARGTERAARRGPVARARARAPGRPVPQRTRHADRRPRAGRAPPMGPRSRRRRGSERGGGRGGRCCRRTPRSSSSTATQISRPQQGMAALLRF